MRYSTLILAALAPLIAATPALAQDDDPIEIDGDLTEPVRTSEADNGAPADTDLTGQVELEGSGPGLINDSDNTLALSGAVLIQDQNGAIGVLLQGGPGDRGYTQSGQINMADTAALPNPDDDTDFDGPFTEQQNKTGILVEGPDPYRGDIVLEQGASITVEGNDSQGLRLDTALQGDLIHGGGIQVIGDDVVGVDLNDAVSGNVTIDGGVGVTGEGASAVNVGGDVDGVLTIDSSISSTGYRTTSAFGVVLENLDADDLLTGGEALVISADIGGGVVIGDAGALVLSSGSADAILITAADSDSDVVISPWQGRDTDEDGEIDNADAVGYGFANLGTIQGTGIYEGFDASALRLVGSESAQVRIEGGLYNVFRIRGQAVEGDAEGIVIGNNVDVGRLFNDRGGEISALSQTENSGAATAIHIGATGVLSSIRNDGQIVAQIGGEDGTASAIIDESGTLQTVENTNIIRARLVELANEDNDSSVPPGAVQTIAIDMSNSALDALIRQSLQVAGEDDPEDFVPPTPSIEGDILLGSGNDLVDIQAGDVTGAIAFGDGADQLILDGGGTIAGPITDSDGDLVIQVGEGTLQIESAEVLRVKSADFGDGAEFRVILSGDTIAKLEADGVIRFDEGAVISGGLSSLVGEGGVFEIISAGDLQIEGSLETIAETTSPYLYNSSLAISETNPNTLVLNLSRRTAQELGLNTPQSAAYDAAFNALVSASALNNAFAEISDRDAFLDAYNQILPDFSGAALQFVVSNMDGALGAVGNRLDVARLDRARNDNSVWMQEFGYFADREDDALGGGGYRGQGFGFAAGADWPWGAFYAAGFNVVFSTSEIEQIAGFDSPIQAKTFGAGFYAGGAQGNLTYDVYLGGGVDWFESERRIVIGAFDDRAIADWLGYHFAGSARVGYDWDAGWLDVRPLISVDYVTLREDGYEETGLSDLNLIVDERSSDVFSASATLALSRRFGTDTGWWAPQLKFGVRNEFGGTLAETSAQFANVSNVFVLQAPELPSTSALVGFLLTGGSQYSSFGFNYDADIREGFVRHSARVVVRLTF